MPENPLLKISNLTIRFHTDNEDIMAVDDVSFDLNEGKTIGIVGESGSGKSVTSLAIMGLLPAPPAKISSGNIFFTNKNKQVVDLLSLSEKERRYYRGKETAMIFQEPMTSLNPVYTCGRQVMESILLDKSCSRQDAKKKTLELLGEVSIPNVERVFRSYPHEISGGQKQRVMIAMAISRNPSLLIADEPTTALDVTVQKGILALLKSLQKKYGMAMIFITHDLGLIAGIADHIAVMNKGKIVEYNERESIFKNPQHPYTKGLLACRPPVDVRLRKLPVVSDFMNCGIADINSVEKISGHNIITSDERREHLKQLYSYDPILEIKDIQTEYVIKRSWNGRPSEKFIAVNHVSFRVFEGETLGLVGESGSGKTSIGRTILRLTEASSGQITYKGRDLLSLNKSEMRTFRKNLQIIFQDPYSSLNPRLTAGNAISEPMIVHGICSGKETKSITCGLLEKVGLSEKFYQRYPHEMSGGQRQRISIARALALQPEFIILDESVSALDVSVQAQVLNLLNELKNEFLFTYIFISHDLSVVKFMSDRMIVMKDGKIEEEGDAEQIYFDPQKEYTRNLIASIPQRVE